MGGRRHLSGWISASYAEGPRLSPWQPLQVGKTPSLDPGELLPLRVDSPNLAEQSVALIPQAASFCVGTGELMGHKTVIFIS